MNVINFEKAYCARIRAYLDSYLNNELLVETTHEVLKHLESCKECAAELQARERVKGLLQKAFRQDEAPDYLSDRIRREIRKPAPDSRRWWMLAAAAAMALFIGVWGVIQWHSAPDSARQETGSELALTESEENLQILRVGLGDHVHCALDKGLWRERFSSDKMAERLGPEYADIVSLVKERVPGDYELAVGHRCRFKGRKFVHLILNKQETVISLVITQKDGESFSQSDLAAVVEASGTPLRHARLENMEVTGFETRDHLAFVVSNLNKEENLNIASGLAPSVRDFLARLEA